jgi:TonB family protein
MNARLRQTSQKILLLAAAASLIGHLLMLSLTGLIIPGAGPDVSAALVVDLRESPEKHDDEGSQPQPAAGSENEAAHRHRDETVDLGNRDSRYLSYLVQTKKKIDTLWTSPAQAHEQHEPGIVVVRFTIDRNGRLHQSGIEKSSGVAALDHSALDVIRTAAPFYPFPADMKLARLHIIATFKYRMED